MTTEAISAPTTTTTETAPKAETQAPKAKTNETQSFENAASDNPLASQRKTLKEKIMERAMEVEARKAKEKEATAKKEPKKSAVVNPEIETPDGNPNDAAAFVKPQGAKKTKAPKKEEVEAEPANEEYSLEPTVDPAALGQPEQVEPEVSEWKPDYKFKYVSKDGVETEGEIPEKFRDLIKDKETEEELRKLFAASKGIEYVQESRNKYKTERDETLRYVQEVHGRLQQLEGLLGSKNVQDLDTAFEIMGLPEEKVLQWVWDKIQYQQLEPGQKQAIDALREADKRARMAEQSQQAMLHQAQQAMIQARNMALDALLERPDIKSVVSAYDNRPGKKPTDPSFKDLVINHGKLAWQDSGGKVTLSPQEAVEAVLQGYGIAAAFGQQATPMPSQAPAPTSARMSTQNQSTPRQHQSLPNVSGRAASPTKPAIKTKADLMRIRQQILNS